jgi:putative transposase
MVLTIKGEHHYLWRAVDQDRNVLDILGQRCRDKKAAKKFFCKLLKGLAYVPRVLVTDKLKSYGAAKREILPGGTHRQHRYLNNRAENSHQPRVCESDTCNASNPRAMPNSSSLPNGPIAQPFRPRRHRFSAPAYRQEMKKRFQIWREIMSPVLAA